MAALGLALFLGAAGLPAAASPLRVSLHGLDDPGPATVEPERVAPARFVAAGDATLPQPEPAPRPNPVGRALGPAAPDGGAEASALPFVPSLELPQPAPGTELSLPPPDEAHGVVRLLRGDGAVPESPPATERRLGEFAPPPPAAVAAGHGSIDGPPPDNEPWPDLPLVDQEALQSQRLAVVLVVLPLVLVVTAVWWRLDRSRHRGHRTHGGRHRRHEGHRAARAREGGSAS